MATIPDAIRYLASACDGAIRRDGHGFNADPHTLDGKAGLDVLTGGASSVYGADAVGGPLEGVPARDVELDPVDAGVLRQLPVGQVERLLRRQEALLQRPYADEAIACTPVQLCRLPRHLVDEGVEGAIAGTALYEGRFTLEDALALTRGGA